MPERIPLGDDLSDFDSQAFNRASTITTVDFYTVKVLLNIERGSSFSTLPVFVKQPTRRFYQERERGSSIDIGWLIRKSPVLAMQSGRQILSLVRPELKENLYQSAEHLMMKDDLIKR